MRKTENLVILMGDFYSQIQLQKIGEKGTIGRYNYGRKNKRE